MSPTLFSPVGVQIKLQSDLQVPITQLVSDLNCGLLKPAPHQRPFKWSVTQVKNYISTILQTIRLHGKGGILPTGSIVTYQIPDGLDTSVYINDGFQRISAVRCALLEPAKYFPSPFSKYHKDDLWTYLSNYLVLVQHRHYSSHDQALFWFQRLNSGTPLTSAEFYHGFLLERSDSPNTWGPILEELHVWLGELFRGKTVNPLMKLPSVVSVQKRHDYQLLYRYLSRNKNIFLPFAQISAKLPDVAAAEKGYTVEQQLRTQLDQLGMRDALTSIASFKRVIDKTFSEILSVWELHHGGKDIPASVARFLLEYKLWANNNNLSPTEVTDFYQKLLGYQFHGGMLFSPNSDERLKFTFSSDSFKRLYKLYGIIGFTLNAV